MGGPVKRGKKAWRGIDATAAEDAHAGAAAAAKSGAHVSALPDDALFFVDTKPAQRASTELYSTQRPPSMAAVPFAASLLTPCVLAHVFVCLAGVVVHAACVCSS
jgi:hypothetical protein